MAHLEALEILSNQSEKKVQMLLAAMSDETVAALKPQLVRMKNTFELEDNDDGRKHYNDHLPIGSLFYLLNILMTTVMVVNLIMTTCQ